jgi:hypothetical protein
LGAALAAAGYGQLCLWTDRPPEESVGPKWTGALITLGLALSSALALRAEFKLGVDLTVVAVGALMMMVLLVAQKQRNVVPMFVAWIALGCALAATRGVGELLWAYGLGILAALLIYGAARLRRNIDLRALVRSVPFLFPLVLLLLFVPLVTEDLWRVASEMNGIRFVAVAVLTVFPLALFLTRKLVASLPGVIQKGTSSITSSPESVGEVNRLVERLVGSYAGSWVLNHGRTFILQGYEPAAAAEYGPFLTTIVRRPLSRALAWRTLAMLLGLGAAVFGYLYLLAVSLVDTDVARRWSGHSVPTTTFDVLGLSLQPPGGPYIAITVLLGIVAVGAFLALLIVEESYSQAIAGALINEPVMEYLLLALPYVRLRERQILGEAPAAQEDPDAPPSASEGD